MPRKPPFDAHLVRVCCCKCWAPITEPIGSFRRPYFCWKCGVEIRIPNLAAMEARARILGDYKIVCRGEVSHRELDSPRMKQEDLPRWEVSVEPA